MKYVIDTHIFLWLLFAPQKLPGKIVQIIQDPDNEVAITSISFMEISIKYNLGKLELEGATPEELPAMAKQMEIEIISIDIDVMSSFYKLPRVSHKDPFDRIIIWHCIRSNSILLSVDGEFEAYTLYGLKVVV
jgi:PIN domain nuclease of toxin-antitoxin system